MNSSKMNLEYQSESANTNIANFAAASRNTRAPDSYRDSRLRSSLGFAANLAGSGYRKLTHYQGVRSGDWNRQPVINLQATQIPEESTLSDHKQEEAFRVIDRRPFTAEGELRKEVVEEEEREAKREAAKIPPAPPEAAKTAAPPAPAETPKSIPGFENLVRMLGSNAAMVLGAYADPRTGQPVIDPEAARELIDMLDALHEKTKGNLAPEEDNLLLDLLGKLKMTYLEINQAVAAEAAKAKAKARP